MEDLQIPAGKSEVKASATDSKRQAILTRYHGPTNHRGTRISATAQAGRVSIPYDYALNSGDNHAAAAKHLAEHFGWNDWPGEWIGGQLPNQDYAWTWRELPLEQHPRIQTMIATCGKYATEGQFTLAKDHLEALHHELGENHPECTRLATFIDLLED